MNNKNALVIVCLLLAIAVAGFFFFNKNKDNKSPAPVQAKIDIEAVCNGALAYMTFTDGKSADLFVKDCIDGKHPEVIERYRADLNLNAAVEI